MNESELSFFHKRDSGAYAKEKTKYLNEDRKRPAQTSGALLKI